MKRLRALAHDYLLPLVIGSLVLRALIPVGFMPGGHASLSLTAALCNAPAAATPAFEVIEIPGSEAPASAGASHCDFCLQPVMAAASVSPMADTTSTVTCHSPPERQDAPSSRFALERAQIPRAPPPHA